MKVFKKICFYLVLILVTTAAWIDFSDANVDLAVTLFNEGDYEHAFMELKRIVVLVVPLLIFLRFVVWFLKPIPVYTKRKSDGTPDKRYK